VRFVAGRKHVIEFTVEALPDRVLWGCDCGVSGSCPVDGSDTAMERHLNTEDYTVWRYVNATDWARR